MSNVIPINKEKNDFKTFMANNRNKIYANTPIVNSVKKNDEWVNETEWDNLFRELSAKEN